VGVAARAEEASGEALCGVRRATTEALVAVRREMCHPIREVGWHMTADRGHPRPRSPPGGRESCCPRAECHAPWAGSPMEAKWYKRRTFGGRPLILRSGGDR
jgi:hypothetical protein